MTAKRGMQWKTSWRRQKPALGSTPKGMWWFTNFGVAPDRSRFEQALPAPSIGDLTAPFWIGAIFGSDASFLPPGFPPAESTVARGTTFPVSQSWDTSLVWDPFSSAPLVARAEVNIGFMQTDSLLTLGAHPAPPPPPLIRGVLQMLVVEPALVPNPPGPPVAGRRATLWVDGAVQKIAAGPGVYVPSAGPVYLQPGFGFLNSMAGGNALPTTQEIQDWFSASRYALPFPSAQPIPGKTLDQYDAGVTPAVVPPVLANLAGGQPAPLVQIGAFPPPFNLFLPTVFNY